MIKHRRGVVIRHWTLLLGLAAACSAHSAPTLEDYGSLPAVQQMAVSPNGRLVAYRKVANGQDHVLIADLVEKKAVNALDVSKIKQRRIRFANNDALLLWVEEHRRVAGFRGRFDVSTVFSFNFRTNDLSQVLVPGDGVVYRGQTGLGRVVGISPDGKYLYMPAYSGEWTPPKFSLLKVRTDGTGKPRIQKGSDAAAVDFFVDAEGDILAREDFDESDDLHIVKVRRRGGKWEEIFRRNTAIMNHSFVGVTDDGRNLVAILTSGETERDAYHTLSLADGALEGPVFGRDDADVERVITDFRRVTHGVEYSGFTPEYEFFDQNLNRRFKAIQKQFPEHAVHLVDFSPDWKHLIVRVEGSRAPGDYYLSSAGKGLVFVTSAYSGIRPDDVHPLGRVTFEARDGMSIPTLITMPRSSVDDIENLPAVIMPHGGPASYDAIGFNYMAQALAQQGYLVIMPQFRGSTGFGWQHRRAGYGEWGRKMQDDISDAVAHFTGNGMVDPDRVCIVGASYGGYAALAGGAFTPNLYRCVVSINGIGDLEDFHNWIERERGDSSQTLAYWELQIGGDRYAGEDAAGRSPRNFAADFQAPVLLIHSSKDEIVRVQQSEDMQDALEKQQKPVKFVELEGDDHYLSLGKTRLQALKATVGFVKDHLQ